mgnify:CR=1 FL=1
MLFRSDTLGTFSNSVEDSALLLHVLTARPMANLSARVAPPRVGIARTSRWKDADPAEQAAVESAAGKFSAAGASVSDAALPPAAEALYEAQGVIMNFETARAFAWEASRHRGDVSPELLQRLDDGWATSREKYDAALRTAEDARRQFADLMRGFDLLVTPSARGEAPRGLLHASLTYPVDPGTFTLLYPKWIPGEHGPTGALVVFQAHGLPAGFIDGDHRFIGEGAVGLPVVDELLIAEVEAHAIIT